jgi:membrane-bound lytic murein transglycosylase F
MNSRVYHENYPEMITMVQIVLCLIVNSGPQLTDDRILRDHRRMKRSKRTFTHQRFLPWIMLIVLALVSCGRQVDDSKRHPLPGQEIPLINAVNTVERDLPEIQIEGVLRMATHPGPLTWMVFEGREAGFEWSLLHQFCRDWNLRLEVVLPEPDEELIDLLTSGRADVIAAGLLSTNKLKNDGAISQAFEHTRFHLVLPTEDSRPDSLTALDGLTVTVPWDSQAADVLRDLRQQHDLRLNIVRARPSQTLDDLFRSVASGEIDATAAPASTVRAASTQIPQLRLGPPLAPPSHRVWLLRHQNPNLMQAINHYLTRNYGRLPNGPRRSRFYGILHERYLGDLKQVRYYSQDRYRAGRSGRLCAWDELVSVLSDSVGLDPLIVTSLIFQESRFDPTVVSSANAVGLMQVLPRFAKADSASLHDPETNLRTGIDQLADIWRSFDYLPLEDRWPFTLATYHAGVGHMNDARRIAMDSELDPNRWTGNVAVGLGRLRERVHNRQTRHGFYRGDTSVIYAESILRRAEVYRRILALQPE